MKRLFLNKTSRVANLKVVWARRCFFVDAWTEPLIFSTFKAVLSRNDFKRLYWTFFFVENAKFGIFIQFSISRYRKPSKISHKTLFYKRTRLLSLIIYHGGRGQGIREMSGIPNLVKKKNPRKKNVNEHVIKKKIFRKNYFVLKKYLMVFWRC